MKTIRFVAAQVPLLKSGAKRRTIRRLSVRAPEPDERFILAGSRFRPAPIEEVTCSRVTPIEMVVGAVTIESIILDGEPVADLEAFARLDGFSDLADMAANMRKWHGVGRFVGRMIEWCRDIDSVEWATADAD